MAWDSLDAPIVIYFDYATLLSALHTYGYLEYAGNVCGKQIYKFI